MRIYLSHAQFQAIRKSVIMSDLVLIIFTAVAFYYSFFVDIVHFFFFAMACFLVKLLANLFVKKIFRFPSYIHLIAPVPFFTYLIGVVFIFTIFEPIFSFIFLLIFGVIIALLCLIKYICLKYFNYKLVYHKITPSYRLYNYYILMGGFIGKNMNIVCLILQLACFYSIVFSVLLGFNYDSFFENIHPIKTFVFDGFFAPLLFFAFFNFIEIIVFLFAKFPKSGIFFEYEIDENFDFTFPAVFAYVVAFFIASTPFFAYPFVKDYLGSQYKPTMEKLIEQKRNYQ